MKRKTGKQNLLAMQETSKDNFEFVPNEYNTIDFNKEWKDYWYNYFSEKFKDHSMFKRITELEKEVHFLAGSINQIIEKNKKLFEENVRLGEMIEELKHEYKLRVEEIKELKKKIGNKPKGFFDATGKLITKNIQMKILQEENKKLKESQTQITTISVDTVEKILILKVKGLNYAEIAEKTGVSTASVSRYIRKNQERLRELESSAKSETSF